MHKVSAFIEAAWHNDTAEFAVSGERSVIQRLAPADFRLVFDVGASVGDWTREALSHWPNCNVHAFEVAPRTYALLEGDIRGSLGRDRVETHAIGLSDQGGLQTLYYYPDHPELTGGVARHVSLEAIPFEARMETLDRHCKQQGIQAIDYLKIDVEGAEHRVLKGAREMIEAGAISCIQFEHGAFWLDSRFLLRDYFDLLSQRYFIGKIFPKNVVFSDYDWRAENLRFSNYLCVSRHRPDLKRLVE